MVAPAVDINARVKQRIRHLNSVRVQAAELVPIVEPELLIDGDHSIQTFADASARVIAGCVAALWRQPGLALDAVLLKPQMCIPGADFQGDKPSPVIVADHTLHVMRRCAMLNSQPCPPSPPAILAAVAELVLDLYDQGCAPGRSWHHVPVRRAI